MYGDGNKLQFQMFSLLQENIFMFFLAEFIQMIQVWK